MPMTKKHYEHAARYVTHTYHATREEKVALVRGFLNLFATYNPNFNSERFVEACGLEMEDIR